MPETPPAPDPEPQHDAHVVTDRLHWEEVNRLRTLFVRKAGDFHAFASFVRCTVMDKLLRVELDIAAASATEDCRRIQRALGDAVSSKLYEVILLDPRHPQEDGDARRRDIIDIDPPEEESA